MSFHFLCVGISPGFKQWCEEQFGSEATSFYECKTSDIKPRSYEVPDIIRRIDELYNRGNVFLRLWRWMCSFVQDSRSGDFSSCVVFEEEVFDFNEVVSSIDVISSKFKTSCFFCFLVTRDREKKIESYVDSEVDFILDSTLDNEGELAKFVLSSVKRELNYAKPKFAFFKKLSTYFIGGAATVMTALLLPIYPTLFYDVYGTWSVDVVKEESKMTSDWEKYSLLIKNETGSVKSGFEIEAKSKRYKFKSLDSKIPRLNSGEMARVEFFAQPLGKKLEANAEDADIEVSIELLWSDDKFKMKEIRLP